MFPLKQRIIGGYAFGVKTSYSAHHLGVDYRANFVELYAPFNGRVERHDGTQGGITLWFFPNGGLPVMRFMHLSKVVKTGEVKEGELIAITGNSGSLSSAPHLHLDISKTSAGTFWSDFNNFINPETFNWKGEDVDINYVKTHIWKYGDDPQVNCYIDDAAKFGNDWSRLEIKQKPVIEKVVEKPYPVEKIVEVIKEVEKVVEVEVPKEIIKEIIVQAELNSEQKAVLSIWEKIKKFLTRS